MNIQQLRQSVKVKWLSYYEQNRSWLVKMRVWGSYDGLRRPFSGFILATLSVLEPQFNEVISFILSLNNNPDEIVSALGLNFNPDDELSLSSSEDSVSTTEWDEEAVPVVTVASQLAPAETLCLNLPRLDQFVTASRENSEIVTTEKRVSSVAVATKLVNSRKRLSGLLLEVPAVRSPLAITIEVLNKTKTLPSRKFEDSPLAPVPMRFCSLLLQLNCLIGVLFLRQCLQTPVSRHNHGQISPKLKDAPHLGNLLHSHHASSLAAWVDECCQGKEYNPEAAIPIRV
ncbi:DUF5331 domain-containing protein [Nodularia harveyana UHCC-0300]|uniref:DUF5331 domain-containing protein n=1 Tax=Nodularia harveyana UHCC-0300 TaxID=2974287 RepID=A0ABU5UGT6_9CYAN|nr:DUF5331 domain-containing protein [Nodularia harveyana]MEA5582694.1 DUF5331 domain-containing protein [Nodularia harveyana UHCC-0300]